MSSCTAANLSTPAPNQTRRRRWVRRLQRLAPTPEPHPTSPGCSVSVSPGTASPGTSTSAVSPVRRVRPGPQPAPNPRRLDAAHRRRHRREPALYRSADLESPGERVRRTSLRVGVVTAQRIRAARLASDGRARRFALAGLIRCGVCDRRLDSHWNHGRPTYRCHHGYTSPQSPGRPRPKTRYIRENHLVDEISIRLGDEGNDGDRSLIGHVSDVWQQRCTTQERSSSTTAPDGACRTSIRAELRSPQPQDRVSRSVG
ncbi:zinc ribbon domain-containing protein [Amycolatopsis sp. OK19-0408]|uniref:Zinc ribbon domain-containing protein n=1 Tax=Amycolatopsis iheyensis TaxID=2945988 RepID=A0A9X2NHF3_9PSEU|nr:zinc ribbon domain-containing protein [Amycolatopsis iheyensis]MCR6487903.1 zinc ribbon domain-containing protein [Amycolatopsis iheyensis]